MPYPMRDMLRGLAASIRSKANLHILLDFASQTAELNAFFVRRDRLSRAIPERACAEGFVAGAFCEVHDEAGNRVKLSHADQRRILHTLPLVEVEEEDPVHA